MWWKSQVSLVIDYVLIQQSKYTFSMLCASYHRLLPSNYQCDM